MLTADDTPIPIHRTPLPPELTSIILSHVPDARTLRNLILSAPCFYHGFFATSRFILHAVLFNEFGSALLPIALAIHYCERLPLGDLHHAAFQNDKWVKQQVLRDARLHIVSTIARNAQIPDDWSLPDSLALTELHSHADWFASEFAATLTEVSPAESEHKCGPLREREMIRISSAFLRFELYRLVFSKRYRYEERPGPERRKEMLLDKFAPWENEQLTTAYEYLLQRLSLGLLKPF